MQVILGYIGIESALTFSARETHEMLQVINSLAPHLFFHCYWGTKEFTWGAAKKYRL